MIRPVPLLRLSLAAFVLLAMGCTEPRCPRNLVQDRMVCRKCPEGAFVKNNLCMYPDGGEADAGQETDEGSSNASEGDVLDGGADEGSTTVDAAVNPTDAGGSAIESGSADGAFPTADAAPVDAGSCDADAMCCEAGSGCGCAAGQKGCRASCIAQSQCCEDEECPTGARCIAGACGYWCETQARPSGIMASDYQCLDFETGLPAAATWVRSTMDASKLATSMDRAFSQPNSLRTADGSIKWTVTSSTPATSLSFAASMNPVQHPTVLPDPLIAQLVCLAIGELSTGGTLLEFCLNYMYKGALGSGTYTGLYIRTTIIAGAALIEETPLYDSASPSTPLNLAPNVWNAVTMRVDNNNLVVAANGKSAMIAGGAGQDTRVSVLFGASDWTVSYDNVVVSVGR